VVVPAAAPMADAFTGCRRTISWERARLGLDKVEAVECLGSWFPLNLEDEDRDTMIPKTMKWIRSENMGKFIVSVFDILLLANCFFLL
jgi:hypothetical protein